MGRYFLRPRAFEQQFGTVDEAQIFSALGEFRFRNRGPIGSDEIALIDGDGMRHVFFVEACFNGHDSLSLGVHRRVMALMVSAS